MRGRAARIDQVTNRFSLEQVELSVQHGSAREFSGLGLPCTGMDCCGKHRRRHDKPAMRAYFQLIFACERVRRTKKCRYHIVDYRSVHIMHHTVRCTTVSRWHGVKQFCRKPTNLWPTGTHECQRSPADCCRYCDDCSVIAYRGGIQVTEAHPGTLVGHSPRLRPALHLVRQYVLARAEHMFPGAYAVGQSRRVPLP